MPLNHNAPWGGDSLRLDVNAGSDEVRQKIADERTRRGPADTQARRRAVEERHTKSAEAVRVEKLRQSLYALSDGLAGAQREADNATAALRRSVEAGKPDAAKRHAATDAGNEAETIRETIEALRRDLSKAEAASAQALGRMLAEARREWLMEIGAMRDRAVEEKEAPVRSELLPTLAYCRGAIEAADYAFNPPIPVPAPEMILAALPADESEDPAIALQCAEKELRAAKRDRADPVKIGTLEQRVARLQSRVNRAGRQPVQQQSSAPTRTRSLPNYSDATLAAMAQAVE